ncbi:hypothetical protein ASG29_00365 [Sphingomonas sp. Leaf412]|uniref:GTA baseplate fiber-binding domain-containing protein n=1 Tax=Sphingomonas sp. Leaf412 TaxID=1736370 RepID=UPI0006F792D4|nr:phage tail protein [Sphingomonas sp. Leaf412]KQT34663.1 hypothetical protein ASG29_00365 [Sphingomonas sp. Leaf412]
MATLVLTTVGGAIGGPVGAALGAVLGQAVDRRLLATPGRQGPRLRELAVQTSSYGTQMPKVFGTMRVAGSVIWATDLIESRTRQRGAKGQGGTTTYSYAASFAVALSARRIVRVGRIWADGKLLRGAAGDWKSATGFRLYTGTEDQPVDPLIASLASPAPAHRGIAYAVFEQLQLADFGNRIPSLTFEVVADEGEVAIGSVARALGEGAIVGDGPADLLTGFSAGGSSVAGALGVLAEAAQAWFVPDGAGMAMRNRIDAAVALDEDVRIDLTRGAADAVPVALSVSHYDPARDFQVGSQAAHRGGAGWRDEAVELPAAVSAGRARQIADAGLLAREAARVRRRATTDVSAIAVAPGDAVLPAGEGAPWRVTRATLEEMRVVLDLVPVPVAAAARTADPGVVAGAPDRLIGRTVVTAFELPPLDDALPQVPQLLIAAAGTEPGWRGALLSVSRDGATWEDGGATAAPATMGTIATPLGAAPATLVDRVHAVEVEFPHEAMALASADAAALDRGANLALIGDELIQFGRATPIGATRWRIADLWRGRRGTAAAAHDAGARFVLIEAATLAVVALPGVRAAPLRISAIGVGDGGVAATATMVPTGASVAPPAPVHVRATPDAGGGLALRWIRRSRRGWRWDDGGDAPLVEEQEAYRITLPAGSGTRDVTVTQPALDLAAGEWEPGIVAIRQLGTLAESMPATTTI